MTDVVQEYRALLDSFVSGDLPAQEFERRYLDKFKQEARQLDEATYAALDEMFGHVDAFCADDELRAKLSAERPGWYLDAEELRARARQTLGKLR